ncbi:hypothetical protein GCM10010919_21960 [Alishewanella longhuensis]|uniref:Dicarboxylate transport domain-containing protein n=1 Tax=Alishewanella longhuensis TaxID=1091037 RepID=A0ABQ3L000_9ALTE|nr:YdbH domain-containing protein [Alishewanella longhuensis]GHG71015.1 hypothetical protein GCM10010919_21960 [Alishewanella longhuensis]
MRRLFKSILILLLGLPVILFVGWLYLHAQLKQAGISDWSAHLDKLSLHQLVLTELVFTLEQPDYQLNVSLKTLRLDWSWPAFFRIKLQNILLDSADIHVERFQAVQHESSDSAFELPAEWQLPPWLPQLLKLEHVNLTLPCGQQHCQLQATALISGDDAGQWQAKLQLIDPKHQLTLHADFYYEHHASDKTLQGSIQLDQQLALSLKQYLNSDRQARTELALAIAPPSAALLAMLADFQLTLPAEWLTQFKQPVQLYAAGDWRLPATLDTSTHALPLADASFQLIARAPDPFIVPGVGWLKGEITSQLKLSDSQLTQWQLEAELELTHYANTIANGSLADTLLASFDTPLAPLQITLQSGSQLMPDAVTDTTTEQVLWDLTQGLPISVRLSSKAPLQSLVEANLLLGFAPTLTLELQQSNVAIAAKTVKASAIQLEIADLQLQSNVSGFWQATGWQFTLADNSQLSGTFKHPSAQAKLQLQLENTEFTQHGSADIAMHGKTILTIAQLQQPQLNTQDWQWQADLTGNLSQLALKGELTNDSGLSIPHQLQWQASNPLNVNWQVADIFLLAGNPLHSTLAVWPELLTLSRGRLIAAGQLSYDADHVTASALLQLRELNGLYDRTLFSGLTSQISVKLQDQQLSVDIPALQLTQLNHGMQLGPVAMTAQYTASLAEPLTGKLQLSNLTMSFMQGELAVEPQLLDLSAAEQQLVLVIKQLDLAELMRQHPTTDLNANGKLSGRIPITIKDKQFSVQQGMLAAEQPGGRLQYRTAASATGSSNPGMKLVFDALSDFHFSVLSSEVSYSHSGKLLLSLQLQGANPAVQQGRAINLNINLEEDLPAMIASLQLANKLNDTLTKRVQQHIQRQQAAKAAAGENP